MTNEERQFLQQKLIECDLVEFARIVDSVISQRLDTRYDEESERTKLVLGEAHQEKEDGGTWSLWKVAVVATADIAAYDREWEYGNGEAFLQQGFCDHCQIELVSHAKNAVCPVCGGRNALT